MYQEFSIINIIPRASEKKIIIEANKAINNLETEKIIIDLYERKTKTPVLFDFEINFDKLIITLRDWPIPNTDYILGVKGIESITEDVLESNIKKKLIFTSDVTSTVSILSPTMFEKVKDLTIKLKESTINNESLINSYYIEVAKDSSFYETLNKFNCAKDELEIILKESGQYFIRARVQKDENNFGAWSEYISFIYKDLIKEEVPEKDEEIFVDIDMGDETPEVIISDPLIIKEFPEQGVTPEEGFLFVFNNPIDDLSVDEIIVIRKDVR